MNIDSYLDQIQARIEETEIPVVVAVEPKSLLLIGLTVVTVFAVCVIIYKNL
ncbi:MAG: hypothetical protein AAFW00_19810 [Bacteroidota bacterium]